jgi:RNA polymerase sigma-70 factor, ECF subfamily
MSDEGVATRVSKNLGEVAPPSETTVREALARDDLRRGVETTQSLYGAEVFGFMTAVLDDPTIARDVYVRFAERLWRSLGRFRWHCSLRTWCYALARSEIARRREQTVTSPALPPPPPSRGPSAGGAPEVDSLSAWTTARSTLRGGVDLLRSQLAQEDREILVLHVDRGLSWRDVALTVLENVSEGEIERESDRLRLRFAAVKEQLAKAAAAHGITPRSEHSDGNIEAGQQRRSVERRPSGRDR